MANTTFVDNSKHEILFDFLTLISFSVSGQLIEKIKSEISGIQTTQQANEYLASHATFNGQLFELNSRVDTTYLDSVMTSTDKGDLKDFLSEDKESHFIFKTLETTNVNSFRVQYIFLDNKKLALEKIDSLRKVIMMRLGNGDSFENLAKEYSMDGNSKKGGDLGWFEEGMMRAEFEASIKKRAIGEIFMVDIPSEKWYYVVRNSHAPRVDKKVTILYVEIKSSN